MTLTPVIQKQRHIKPKVKGGHSTRSNMGACCSKCNSRKGSQLVFDYFNDTHPCYSEAKASKIKEWTDQHFIWNTREQELLTIEQQH